jgi:hypothetical protein
VICCYLRSCHFWKGSHGMDILWKPWYHRTLANLQRNYIFLVLWYSLPPTRAVARTFLSGLFKMGF